MHERRYHRGVEKLREPERVERLEVDRVVDLALREMKAGHVLDVGTGSGLFAEAFARRGMVVTGLDANPEMVAAARAHLPGSVFREGAAEALPFADQSFDLVFMGLVLHETDDPEQALREAARVTRQRVAILEWPFREQDFGPGLEERFPLERLQALVHAAGFTSVRSIPLQHLLLVVGEKPLSPGDHA